MREILPGVFHWSTFHEGIRSEVDSYFLAAATPGVLVDPRVPEDGLEWFEDRRAPEHVYLTNRHHYRHSDRFAERFGATVWCNKHGLHEFREDQAVEPFEHGDELPGGILALEVGVLCPEETALWLAHGGGIMAIGDAIIRLGGSLGFVPEQYMGDDPAGVKRGIRRVFLEHLGHEFDHLLFAHGRPLIGGAKGIMRRFLEDLDV